MAVTSKYQPFTFQERISPILALQEEYNKLNESIIAEGEKSNQYYQYLDPDARAIVDQYNGSLNKVAQDLSANGMKAVSRNTLFALKRQYNDQILPINKAAENYGAIQAQIRELQMKDPTLMIQSVPTVSELMKDPSAVPSILSGATLYKSGTNAANQIPNLTYEQIQSGNIPNMEEIVEQIAIQSGVAADNAQAREYIRRGIMDGVGVRASEMAQYAEKVRIQEASDMRKIAARTAASISVENLKQKNRLAIKGIGKSGSGSSRGSGTAYNRQMDGTVYIKGDQEYAYNGSFGDAQKDEAKAAEAKSKAKGTSVYSLSREHKIRALNYIGVEVPADISIDELENLIDENESALLDYTYKEYVDEKHSKNDEFKMSPKKIKRDVGVPDLIEEEDEDFILEDE